MRTCGLADRRTCNLQTENLRTATADRWVNCGPLICGPVVFFVLRFWSANYTYAGRQVCRSAFYRCPSIAPNGNPISGLSYDIITQCHPTQVNVPCLNPSPSRPVLGLPTTEGSKAELTWVIGYIPRWFTCPQTVTHPGTNHLIAT